LARLAGVLMRRVEQDGFEALDDPKVLDALARAASEEGDDGGQRGLPGIGGAGNAASPVINIIPPPPSLTGACAPVVLVIARKPGPGGVSARPHGMHGRIPPINLAAALRLLRENLIGCGCGPQGMTQRVALILSDHWDRRTAYESRCDVAAHGQVAGLRHAALHWDGQRWWRVGL
jgi:hypothetical protein